MTKYFVKTAAFALSLSLFFASCSEMPGGKSSEIEPEIEHTTAELIVGEWDIISYNQDGEERMGSSYSAFTLEFSPLTEGSGIVGGDVAIAISGNQGFLNGEYRLNEATEQIIISRDVLGQELTVDLSFQGKDQLIMNGFIEELEVNLTIRASRISN